MHNKENIAVNALIIKQLSGLIDPIRLLHACLHSRKNARLYDYCDVIREACSKCFYWRNGAVYVFDGMVWIEYDKDVLKYLIRDALVASAGEASDRVKGDWVDYERKLFSYAMDGIRSHVMEYNSSLVGFSNGVWDFSDMRNPVKHTFAEAMPVTSVLPYKYDETATCPVWLGFLHEMLREEEIETLQKFMALGCYDRKNMDHRVEESLWLIGSGANGKTTIQSVIRLLFGDWNVSSTRLDALLDRNIDSRMRSMGAIEGKIFNMCQEISGTDIEKGSDVFKSLVSGEPQDVRVIGGNIHTAYDIPYLIFSMNQIPSNKKMDKAFARRMVRIDFHSAVRREDMDRGLLTKLTAELSGIRNWVIQGWYKLERDGFSVQKPGRSEKMTDADIEMHIANGLTIDVWLDQWSFLWPAKHIGHDEDEVCLDIRSQDLYADYADYCLKRLGCQPDTSNSFGRQMHDRLNFESRRKAVGIYYRVYCDKSNRFNVLK